MIIRCDNINSKNVYVKEEVKDKYSKDYLYPFCKKIIKNNHKQKCLFF